jgi:phosphate transport system substrate-binding protein
MKIPRVPFCLLSVLLAQFLAQSAPAALQLQGAGATFPAPLYLRWIAEYTKAHPGVQINYQAIGSGAGIKQFTQNLVAFGASDAAMTDKEIAAVKRGVVLIPGTAGSIVLASTCLGLKISSFPGMHTSEFFLAKSRNGVTPRSLKQTKE